MSRYKPKPFSRERAAEWQRKIEAQGDAFAVGALSAMLQQALDENSGRLSPRHRELAVGFLAAQDARRAQWLESVRSSEAARDAHVSDRGKS